MTEPKIVLAKDLTAHSVPIIGVHETPVGGTVTADLGADTDLHLFDIPAGALSAYGDSLEFEYLCELNNADASHLLLKVGTTTIFDSGTIAASGNFIVLRGRIIIDSAAASSAIAYGNFMNGAGLLTFFTIVAATDFTAEQPLLLHGTSVADADLACLAAVINFRGRAS